MCKRFEQEAQAAAGLIHPNIVQVYAFGQQDGVHYIAQEYVQGLNLRQFLNRKGPPELLVAYHVMRQVAAALAVAGDAGIVHRDIKPENILITRKGEAKVTDFGLAQLADSEQRVQLTQVGMTMGTPLYMSPEQINGEAGRPPQRHLFLRRDVLPHAVGAASVPGRNVADLGHAAFDKNARAAGSLRSDLPPVMGEIVHKMMARIPADRYQHAREITQDLKQVARILKEEPDAAGPPSRQRSPPSRPEVGGRRSSSGRSPVTRSFWLRPWQWSAGLRGARMVAAAPKSARRSVHDTGPDSEASLGQGAVRAAHGQLPNEDAWRAVLGYFPDDRTYTPEAKERLAVLDLKSRRLDEAQKLFDDLESTGRENPTAKAAGIAGNAVIASLQGNYLESQRLIVYDLRNLARPRTECPTISGSFCSGPAARTPTTSARRPTSSSRSCSKRSSDCAMSEPHAAPTRLDAFPGRC